MSAGVVDSVASHEACADTARRLAVVGSMTTVKLRKWRSIGVTDRHDAATEREELIRKFNENLTLWSLPDCPRCGSQMEAVGGHDQCRSCGFSPREEEYDWEVNALDR